MAKKTQPKGPGDKPKQGNKQRGNAPVSPLAPMTPKALRRQAKETMRAVYKPAFKQLGREEAHMLSISEKRKADNAYYLNWLDKQSGQLQAHQDAANAALEAAGSAASADVAQNYEGLRDQLVATGESTPGVISDAGNATAFDVSGQANRDQELIGNARQQSLDQIRSGISASDLAQANNFATIAAAEASRVGDQWKALSQIADAKQQVRLARGADTAKEVARLLDREVQKSQIRGQISASQTEAALKAKKFGLDLSKFGLEAEKFNFERTKSNRKFGLENREANETKRYHEATAESKSADTRQEKIKSSHKITAIIQEGISTIASNKNLQKQLEDHPELVKRRLMKILGSATAANAAVELVSTGKLSGTTKESLKQIGYIIPPKWR